LTRFSFSNGRTWTRRCRRGQCGSLERQCRSHGYETTHRKVQEMIESLGLTMNGLTVSSFGYALVTRYGGGEQEDRSGQEPANQG
jgi:hypothetical protein